MPPTQPEPKEAKASAAVGLRPADARGHGRLGRGRRPRPRLARQRAAAGVGRRRPGLPDLLTTLLKSVDADTVRSALALAGGLRDLDPEESEKVADGIRKARSDAAAAAAAKPEGAWALFKRIKDPDTRRGICAALAALSALGCLPRSSAGTW